MAKSLGARSRMIPYHGIVLAMGGAVSEQSIARLAERNGWRLKLPDQPIVLSDSRLFEYRDPAERRMLALSMVAIVVIAVSLMFAERDILIAVAAVYGSMLITTLQAKVYYRMQGAEVTPTQFPAIFELAEELRRRFQAPPTRIFVLRKLSYKAETLGLRPPYVIVLTANLIDAVGLEGLPYVLGQAFGHICFGHTRVAVLLGGEESSLPAILSWVAWVRDMVFAGYWRAAAASADRAGILACMNVADAIRTQVKISVGTNQLDEVRAEDLIEQAFKVSQGLTRLQATLIRWRTSAPPLIPRLEAMIAWAGLPQMRGESAGRGGAHPPTDGPSQRAGDPRP